MIIKYEFAYHMMIKISLFKVFATVFLALPSFGVCQSGQAAEPYRVVTSFYPVYVAALNVTAGVEGVEISNLANQHLGCLHDYQLNAGDVRSLADADLLIVNGAGTESFLGNLGRQLPSLQVRQVSGGTPLMDGNPHVWVSFEGARHQVSKIASVLSLALPEQAEAFSTNAEQYQSQITALEEKIRATLNPYAGSAVITFHGAFPYFARDFGLELVGAMACESGHEPSARELADMVKLVRARQVKVLLAESQSSALSAQVVARETEANVYFLDPGVTGPAAPENARGAWVGVMEKNLGVLERALR